MSWRGSPFDAFRDELARSAEWSEQPDVRLDVNRAKRTGLPEFVLAGSKRTTEVATSLARLAGENGRGVATRCREDQLAELPALITAEFIVDVHELARGVVAYLPGSKPNRTGGKIGIVTAGSSDRAAAAEAALIATELGCEVFEAFDVGVAGLHRLVAPLEAMATARVHAIIVAAGMDGALPSVVAGLVPVPVIGLPTSIGYGYGGQGTGALMTMLQSCAPGLVVVNIDNGVGAACAAAKIASQASRGSAG